MFSCVKFSLLTLLLSVSSCHLLSDHILLSYASFIARGTIAEPPTAITRKCCSVRVTWTFDSAAKAYWRIQSLPIIHTKRYTAVLLRAKGVRNLEGILHIIMDSQDQSQSFQKISTLKPNKPSGVCIVIEWYNKRGRTAHESSQRFGQHQVSPKSAKFSSIFCACQSHLSHDPANDRKQSDIAEQLVHRRSSLLLKSHRRFSNHLSSNSPLRCWPSPWTLDFSA